MCWFFSPRVISAVIARMAREVDPDARWEALNTMWPRYDPKGPLWHYTNSAGLIGILERKVIHATHVAHLNDRRELIQGEEVIADVASKMRDESSDRDVRRLLKWFGHAYNRGIKMSSQEIFVASFCRNSRDRLSQWRGYGGEGTGYSVGIDSFPEYTFGRLKVSLMRVIYDRSRFRSLVRKELEAVCALLRPEDLEEQMAVSYMMNLVAPYALLCKHSSFSEEKEWRLVATPFPMDDGDETTVVKYRSGRAGVVPFVPIPLSDGEEPVALKGVCVGPSTEPDRDVRAVQGFLRSLGYNDSGRLVTSSRIPLRR